MALDVAPDSREFLSSCLKAALDDPDLIDAISDQALEQGMSALTIGQGLVSVDQLKEKLYLTVDEAKSVLNICTSMVAGGTSSKSGSSDHFSLCLQSSISGSVAMNVKDEHDVVASAGATDKKHQDPAVPFEPLDMILDNAAVVVVSRTTPHASEKKLLVSYDSKKVSAPQPDAVLVAEQADVHQIVTPKPVEARVSERSLRPEPAEPSEANDSKLPQSTPPPEPVTAKLATVSAATGQLKQANTASSPVRKPLDSARVTTPRKPSASKPELPSPEPSSVSPRLRSLVSSPGPSYLKPTAAHKARISKDVEVNASVNLTSVPENTLQQRKRRTLFSRMASTLLVPTQAFVMRVTGRSEEVKAKRDSPVSRASVMLETLLSSPQGQRVTKPKPFALRSEMRAKDSPISTEQMELAEAREKAFKRNPIPKHVHESRPIVPVQRSAPKDPNAVFEPFQLASLELHQKKVEEKRKKLEEEVAREEEARRFKARVFDPRIASSPITPLKPAASPVTKPEAPVFASEARVSHYKEVIEPARKAKESELNKDKQDADLKVKELQEMNMDDYRKTLEFKARPMPNFSSPFRVDRALSRPVTEPLEPKLHTVDRLGEATSRDDKEGPGLGKGMYDGAGFIDAFSASLRKSTSFGTARLSMVSNKSATASRRNSTLRQSDSALSPRGARISLGSTLQAAIRAAAHDAARDLAAANDCTVNDLREEDEAVTDEITMGDTTASIA